MLIRVVNHLSDKQDASELRWYVLSTKLHQENKVKRELEACSREGRIANILEAYVPVNQRIKVVREGRVERVPLLSCRVFAYATEAALCSFLSEADRGASFMLDCTRGGRMVIPGPEMRCFMDFNEYNFEELVVLEKPFSRYAFDPAKERQNMRARVVDGPFAGMEGVLVRVRKDHRLVFRMGELAVSIPQVWDFHLVRILDREHDPEHRAAAPFRAADLLLGRLQAAGFTDDAEARLRRLTAELQADGSLRRLEERLRREEAKEPGEPSPRLARFVRELDEPSAQALLSLVRYVAEKPESGPELMGDRPIRRFLTPTPGIALPEGRDCVRLRHDGYAEYVFRISARFLRYAGEAEKAKETHAPCYAHVGAMPLGGEERREALLFADWDGLLRPYSLLDGAAKRAQDKTFAEYLPELADILSARHPQRCRFRRLSFGERGNIFALVRTVPLLPAASGAETPPGCGLVAATSPLEKRTAEAAEAAASCLPDSPEMAAAARQLAETGARLCFAIHASTHFAFWRRLLHTVYLHE